MKKGKKNFDTNKIIFISAIVLVSLLALGIIIFTGRVVDNSSTAGQDIILIPISPSSVSIGGVSHTISTSTTQDSTHAVISVDGVNTNVITGNNYVFSGNINVYVIKITHPVYAGDVRFVEIAVSSGNGQDIILTQTSSAMVIQAAGISHSIKMVTTQDSTHAVISVDGTNTNIVPGVIYPFPTLLSM